jgi:hypothetical protein
MADSHSLLGFVAENIATEKLNSMQNSKNLTPNFPAETVQV